MAASWKGHHYIRAYAKPGGPPSVLQLKQRERFKRGEEAWHALTNRQKLFYDRIARGMSGYNVFVGRAVRAIRAGREPEVPLPLRYATADRLPVPTGALLVRRYDRQVFLDTLEDATVDLALTPSDGPYRLYLRRGGEEDEVAILEKGFAPGALPALGSERLGIRLVAIPEASAPPPNGPTG